MAAYALCREFGVLAQEFDAGLKTFTRPPHRMEFVRELKGVTFIDDSKGTNVDAVMHAVDALRENVILIAGGLDKASPFEMWKESFAGKVKNIVVMGMAAELIEQKLKPDFTVIKVADMDHAVKQAYSWSR